MGESNRITKNFFPPLHLVIKVDQNTFFPETCFAYTISKLEFTVCMPRPVEKHILQHKDGSFSNFVFKLSNLFPKSKPKNNVHGYYRWSEVDTVQYILGQVWALLCNHYITKDRNFQSLSLYLSWFNKKGIPILIGLITFCHSLKKSIISPDELICHKWKVGWTGIAR